MMVMLHLSLMLGLILGSFGWADAQDRFPSKPIRLIVPFVAGGASDILARILAQALSDDLGQPVVVENKAGAGGNVGSDFVAKAPADGYTLVLASVGTHAINSSLYAKMPYDPVRDFTPIALIATVPTVLVVNSRSKATTVADLIALAKASPGQLNYASSGVGTTQQLAGEMLKQQAGIDVVHIPYKGGAQAVADLLGGQVTFMFPNIPVALSHIKGGTLRALAVAGPERSPALPDVPTMAEAAGLGDFDVSTWFGVLGPAALPATVAARLNSAINKALATPEMQSKFALQGAQTLTSTPTMFAAYIREEVLRWARVVKQAHIQLD